MCYRCEVCDTVVGPGSPLRRHVIYREDGSIAREVPSCDRCLLLLENGAPIEELVALTQSMDDWVGTMVPIRPRTANPVTVGRNSVLVTFAHKRSQS